MRTTPEDFEALARRIFGRRPEGYGWQADMHRQLDVSLRTVQAWVAGDNPIPVIVVSLLRLLDEERSVNAALKDKLLRIN